MKVCLGQIDTTPGDFDGNLQKIFLGVEEASKAKCDALVFPELTIPGYLSQDLLYDPRYIEQNLSSLKKVVDYSLTTFAGLHIVLGYIERNMGPGKPFFNMAAVVSGGKILGRYKKQLVPFYDVFDEARYYERGEELLVLNIADKRVGIAICEDLWNDKGSEDYSYVNNPLRMYRDKGIEVIFSLNSSPYVHDKAWKRLNLICEQDSPLTIVYVNQRGGQDELVFDGQSFVVQGRSLLHMSNEIFKDTYDIVDTNNCPPLSSSLENAEANIAFVDLFDLLVLCLRDYVKKSGFSQVVIASSGGVDSAVVCKLACEALGPKNVHAIRLPSLYSSEHSREDALELHRNLGCWDYEVPIDHKSAVTMLNEKFAIHNTRDNLVANVLQSGNYQSIADENIQARLRDIYIMHFSNAFGAIPLSTGNKTESACGYYTHFDMNFSFAPIKDLYKFQVVEIAKQCSDIPLNIWRKAPSAELAEGQKDEESLLPYAVLDPIVRAYVEDYVSTFDGFNLWLQRQQAEKISSDSEFLFAWLASEVAEIDFGRILSLMGKMEFKRRQTCPGTKVTKVAFGMGRRVPIVEKWTP